MTLTQLRSSIRFQAKQSSTDISDADLLVVINRAYTKVVNFIMALNENYFETSKACNLVASTQNYTFDHSSNGFAVTDVLKIVRVEVMLDGSNWYVSKPIEKLEISDALGDSDTDDEFSKESPRHYIENESIYFLPIPAVNVTNGAKIWYIQQQTALSGDSDTPNFSSNYHHIIEKLSLADIATRIGDYALKDRMELDAEKSFKKMGEELSSRAADQDYIVKATNINYN